jgi:hypothetical protein
MQQVFPLDAGRRLDEGLPYVVYTVLEQPEAVPLIVAIDQVLDVLSYVLGELEEEGLGFFFGERPHDDGGSIIMVNWENERELTGSNFGYRNSLVSNGLSHRYTFLTLTAKVSTCSTRWLAATSVVMHVYAASKVLLSSQPDDMTLDLMRTLSSGL